jgi:hypothetical protein
MQEQLSRIRTTCASCGGDPGGLIWEGVVLNGMLTAEDIVELCGGALNHRAVVRLFATRQLSGVKLGKFWVIRTSQFIDDWNTLENRRLNWTKKSRARRAVVIDAERQGKVR